MEVDKQLKFKSHQRMQVEFISNNVDVMTHDCLSICGPSIRSKATLLKQQAHSFDRQYIRAYVATRHKLQLKFNGPRKVKQAELYKCNNCFDAFRQHVFCDTFAQNS